ncbi:DUF6597 domain-containing transcriptional factor [Paenibacillus medicaginis]|uniref:DUF6597 domain-containing transcriptional factor n=1 Tax=Paenibacillus medicaginis TaxID=1470560 RepID=A0ABV5C3Y1_9BACL
MIHSYRPVPSPKLQPELHHPGYSYREYVPSHHLAPYIVCYWTMDFQPGAEEQLHRIIPDGCKVVSFLHFDPFCHMNYEVAACESLS